jgi:hypothetical protein
MAGLTTYLDGPGQDKLEFVALSLEILAIHLPLDQIVPQLPA